MRTLRALIAVLLSFTLAPAALAEEGQAPEVEPAPPPTPTQPPSTPARGSALPPDAAVAPVVGPPTPVVCSAPTAPGASTRADSA